MKTFWTTAAFMLVTTLCSNLPPTSDAQALNPDLMNKLGLLLNAKDLPTLRIGLIGVIEDESFEGVPIDPSIAKAFVKTTDVLTFVQKGFNFQKVFEAIVQNKDPAEAFLGTLNFDIFQNIINVTAFFNQPNITRLINEAGVSPYLVEAVLLNLDMVKFFGSIQLVEAYRLFSPSNPLNQTEKLKSFIKLINVTEMVNSIRWNSFQENSYILKYLETVPGLPANSTDLVVAVIKSTNLENVARNGVDFDGLLTDAMADGLSGSAATSTISKRVDFNVLLLSLNVTKFLLQDNIEEILTQNNVDPRMVQLLTHVEMDKFVRASQMGSLIKAYMVTMSAPNDTTSSDHQMREVLNRVNNTALVDSVHWSTLKDDKAFVGLLEDFAPSYADVILVMDFEKLAKGLDFKGLLKEMHQSQKFNVDFQMLQTYVDLSQVLSGIDLGLLIQTYLKANTTLWLSKKCQASFVDMTFPLPVLTPENMAGFNALNTLNHPILQCK